MRISSIIFAVVLILVSFNISYAQPSENKETGYLFHNMVFHSEVLYRYPVKIILLNGRVIVEDAVLFYYPNLNKLILEIPANNQTTHFFEKLKERFSYFESVIECRGGCYIIGFLIKSPTTFRIAIANQQEDKPTIEVESVNYQDRPRPILMVKYNQNNMILEMIR